MFCFSLRTIFETWNQLPLHSQSPSSQHRVHGVITLSPLTQTQPQHPLLYVPLRDMKEELKGHLDILMKFQIINFFLFFCNSTVEIKSMKKRTHYIKFHFFLIFPLELLRFILRLFFTLLKFKLDSCNL